MKNHDNDKYMRTKKNNIMKSFRNEGDIFHNYIDEINLWSDLGVWQLDHDECYSEWFKQELQQIRIILEEFVNSGYSRKVCEKSNLDYKFLRGLAYGISKYSNIREAIALAIKKNSSYSWVGRFALEYAKGELKFFYNINNRYPRFKEESHPIMRSISSAIERKVWKEQGITFWSDLLSETFDSRFKKSKKYYAGKEGLKKAVEEMKTFKETYGREPRSYDKEMKAIIHFLENNSWEEEKISCWSELLLYVFNKAPRKPFGYYNGELGLMRSKKEILMFVEKYNRRPTTHDPEMRAILGALNTKKWEKQKILFWNDLMTYIFGKSNIRKSKSKQIK